MVDHFHTRFELPERSYQAIVRAGLKKICEQAGFQKHRLGEVEIIIAEITSNLIKYARKGGFILARILGDPAGIELIAIDHGPGMKVPGSMMEDGRSTRSTLGHGLGSIKRLSSEFDLYSIPDWGTILFTRSYVEQDKPVIAPKFVAHVLRTAKKDETACGDGWKLAGTGSKLRVLMVDGLGHGEGASEAAQAAVKSFGVAQPDPVAQLRQIHLDIKKTRGAVATVVSIDLVNKSLEYSGVGNITMKIVDEGKAKSCSTYNGIVGHIIPGSLNNHPALFEPKKEILVMHSDGLSSRWDLKKYPGITDHHGMVICAALYKDFDRGNDDTTVFVGRSK